MICEKCSRPIKKDRSNQQNRYYWSLCVGLISDHTGYSKEDIHEILKNKFLKKTIWIQHDTKVREMHEIGKSTASLTTIEFEKYLSDIRSWASLCLAVSIPEPNEVVNA